MNHKNCVEMNVDGYLNWSQIEVGWVCHNAQRNLSILECFQTKLVCYFGVRIAFAYYLA